MFKKFEAKPNFPQLELEIEKYWEEKDTFKKSLENRQGKEPFVFFEGPPTANAKPGLHHVLARAFKDAVCRFQTMRGKYVSRKAGWDTHGLPVELQVEKKLGISGKKDIENIVPGDKTASIAKFNELCKTSVWEFKESWEKMTKRMGYWVDMSDPYVTYDPKYIESVWALLKKLSEKNLIYEGYKVVPYCPRCGTALSSHEVAQGYDEVTDLSLYVKFKVKGQENTYILSWTTTPWTLPGNLALAVGAEIDYSVWSVEKSGTKETVVIATSRVNAVFGVELVKADGGINGLVISGPPKPDAEQTTYRLIDRKKGSELQGWEYEPLFPGAIPAEKLNDKAFKVYTADFVTTGDGTGVVHTAVMYGEDDYQLGEKVGLPKFHTVDEAGNFLATVPVVGGMFVKKEETEVEIIKYLKGKNLLFKKEKYKHTYPFCWRCSTPLLYYARGSWYIKMSSLREKLIENNKDIHWEPEHIRDGRFGEWLREIKDWAISRERYWGTPLPFWRCESCKHVKVVGSYDELGATGIDPHRPTIDQLVLKCEKCGGDSRRVAEVLDVWFDSGAMPYAQWHYPFENEGKLPKKGFFGTKKGDQFPANYISEAIDQTRGWFYTLHAISTALGNGKAYKSVICLGHILDSSGQKMSKSKGNIVDPWEMFDNFGADSIRWYFFSINQPGESKLFKKEDVAVVQRKVFNIVANVYNYFATYANAAGWNYEDDKSPNDSKNSPNVLDRWINARLQETINTATKSTDELNLFRAVRTIEDYINDLSTWYLRRSRGREDKHFFATLYRNLTYTAKLMAPFAPFFSESVYRSLYSPDPKYPESVHVSDWPQARELTKDENNLLDSMQKLRAAAELGNSIRKTEGVRVRQPLTGIFIEGVELDKDLQEIILDELNVKSFSKTNTMVWKEGNGVKLGLELTLTDELKKEGDIRELERAVQALRKDAGLNVGEPAKLYFNNVSGEWIKQLDLKRLSITSVEPGKPSGKTETEVEVTSGKAWLGLEKV